MKLIPLDAVLAEIEKKKKYAQILGDNAINSSMQQFYDGMKECCQQLSVFLNTIEEKEVDLEKAAEQDVCEVVNTCSAMGIPNDHIPSWVQDAMVNEFIHGAKWKEQQFEKNRLAACDKQTEEEAEIEADFFMGIIKKENRPPTFDDAIKYGMKKMKEQMMTKAVDGDITFDYYGDDDKTYGCIAHNSFCLEDFGLKDRDKVKVIVIKED